MYKVATYLPSPPIRPSPFLIPSFFPFPFPFPSYSLLSQSSFPFHFFSRLPFILFPFFSLPLHFPSSLFPALLPSSLLPYLISFPNSLILFPPRGGGRQLFTPMLVIAQYGLIILTMAKLSTKYCQGKSSKILDNKSSWNKDETRKDFVIKETLVLLEISQENIWVLDCPFITTIGKEVTMT